MLGTKEFLQRQVWHLAEVMVLLPTLEFSTNLQNSCLFTNNYLSRIQGGEKIRTGRRHRTAFPSAAQRVSMSRAVRDGPPAAAASERRPELVTQLNTRGRPPCQPRRNDMSVMRLTVTTDRSKESKVS